MTLRSIFILGALCAGSAWAQDIPLQYDPELVRLGFPGPVVKGTVRGQSAWFLIDTGAGVHVFASWFAKAAQIQSHPTRLTTKGSTGVESAVQAAEGESIRIDGTSQTIKLAQATVVELPPVFEKQRIGGLLSPQLLATNNKAAILDLRAPSLSFGAQPPPTEDTLVCQNPQSPFLNRLYGALVTSGKAEASMLVDTGATTSSTTRASALGQAYASRAAESVKTQGVGGKVVVSRLAPDVPLELGGGQAKVELSIGGEKTLCGRDGLIGMDALRQCRLVLGGSTFAWSCGAAGK